VMVGGSVFAMVLLIIGLAVVPGVAPPRLALADGVLTLALVAPLRIAPRMYYDLVRPRLVSRRTRGIVLAGRAELVDLELRRMRRQPGASASERVAGLVLEGPPLDGARLHRVRVLSRRDLLRLLERNLISEISMVPPTSAEFARELSTLCSEHGVRCRSAASLLALSELCTSSEQLLDRPPIGGDDATLAHGVGGRCALVTGAGVSIGRELALQLLRLGVGKLVLVNRGENALFQTERVLAGANDGNCEIVSNVADARSEAAMERLFARHRPDVVFHAAAHKHVPLMESNLVEAIENNVRGTWVIAETAVRYGVKKFIYVSTDKAVKPSSVMGATKRIGEMLVAGIGHQTEMETAIVRFGNVLGSRGSLIPMLKAQIKSGGPVRLTHEDMTRYFMTIPEAVQLILQAGALGERGDVFILDMGEPMRIVDLAYDLIRLHGLVPNEDIPVVFTGIRPGEKLNEELTYEKEELLPTMHPKISVVRNGHQTYATAKQQIRGLLELCDEGKSGQARQSLMDLAWGKSLEPFEVAGDSAR